MNPSLPRDGGKLDQGHSKCGNQQVKENDRL